MITIALITIFTPTYNRKEKLMRCYESLLKQTNKDFIWQIVDDGSTDDTEMYVNKCIEDDIIEIEYIKKNNGGKASAINLSLNNTGTPLWLTLDSDDILFPKAVEIILSDYPKVKDNSSLCGMFGLRSNFSGTSMQKIDIPINIRTTTQAEVRYSFGIPPEYFHVFKTEVIKQYPYPIIAGERYFPLSYVFDQVDQEYEYLVIHRPVMVCDYQNDGITKNKRKLIKNNPKGYTLYKKQLIKFAPDLMTKIKACANYTAGCLMSKNAEWLVESPEPLLTLVTSPIGLVDYILRYKLNISINLE